MSNNPERSFQGLVSAPGIAVGPVFILRSDRRLAVSEYKIEEAEVEGEIARLTRSRAAVRHDLENIIATLRERTDRADVSVFEGHLMILEDEILLQETNGYITDEHLNAEAAVKRTVDNARALFERMNDSYFRERVRDLDDVERRLIQSLMGFASTDFIDLRVPSIVVADELSPSEAVQLSPAMVLGYVTEGGSPTSHASLLARSLGVPAITGVIGITNAVSPGAKVVLDGNLGKLFVDPTEARLVEYKARLEAITTENTIAEGSSGKLRDGEQVVLAANVHCGMDLSALSRFGALGIGLYRSEYLWLRTELEPTEDEQYAAYREAIESAATLSPFAKATIRVLDVGGDKLVRGITTSEPNPFLGNRSLRYLLSHPDTFRRQLRAILRASAHGRTRILYPMVSVAEELDEAALILAQVKNELEATGVAFDRKIAVGAMIEVPAAAIMVDALLDKVDFVSIGTNDLVQYVMAADRGNQAVAHLNQPLNRAVLRLLSGVFAAASVAGKMVGVCGESASDPVIGALYVAMGAKELSMNAGFIPAVSKVLSRMDRKDLQEYAAIPTTVPIGKPTTAIYTACRDFLVERGALEE